MSTTTRDKERTMKLIERLIEVAPDPVMRTRAEKMLKRMTLPMAEVLAHIPGDTVIARAKHLGVTRQSYYGWLNGTSRPHAKMAKKISAITGYDANEIRGRWEDA